MFLQSKNQTLTFQIRLPLFEGPFDLLLFFIQRDELDIYDIPISKITEDFLDYIHEIEEMNIEIASEFILVAATLMCIKAKMLLPRPAFDDEGNEIDPREELIKHLLEYKRFKEVTVPLADMEEERLQMEKRGNILKEVKQLAENVDVEAELQDVDLYKLLKVYQKVMERFEIEKNRPTHHIIQYPYTIEQQKIFILESIKKNERLSFTDIVNQEPTRIAVIFNFLAILELIQLRQIRINVGLGYNNFWIEHPDVQPKRKPVS